jgi:hypothetical protein
MKTKMRPIEDNKRDQYFHKIVQEYIGQNKDRRKHLKEFIKKMSDNLQEEMLLKYNLFEIIELSDKDKIELEEMFIDRLMGVVSKTCVCLIAFNDREEYECSQYIYDVTKDLYTFVNLMTLNDEADKIDGNYERLVDTTTSLIKEYIDKQG